METPAIGPPVPSGFEVRSSTLKGYGLFSTQAYNGSSPLFSDEPIFVMQHTGNRRVVAACANCCAYVGSLKAQLEAIFGEPRFAPLLNEVAGMVHDWEASIAGASGTSCSSAGVRCSQGCMELYCSEACRDAHFRHSHNLLCTGPITSNEHPLIQFKYHALEHADTLLLAAQVLAHLVNRAKAMGGGTEVMQRLMSEALCFCHAPFRDACRPPPGRGKDAEFLAHTDGLVNRAAELLKLTFDMHAPAESAALFANGAAFYSEVLGMFEYNNIDVDIPSPMGSLFLARAKALDIAARSGSADSPRAAAELELLQKLLREKEWVMGCVWGEETTGNFGADVAIEQATPDEENAAMKILEGMDASGHCPKMASSAMEETKAKVNAMSFVQLLQAQWPSLHGCALYATVARANHSCEPNSRIDFPGNSARLVATSLSPIMAGQELVISYIRQDANVQERKQQLIEYGFVCSCPKCVREDSSEVRKASRRLK